mgnify:CR=1 FL=1
MPTSTRRNCPVSRKSDAKSQHFRGSMWASAPTKDLTRFHDFGGWTESSAPTDAREKSCGSGGKSPRFPFRTVGVDAHIDPPSKTETPPRGGGWALLYRVSFSPLQNASQNAIFSVSRRRGRCLHRPAGIARFMAVFRRIRVGFLFCAVGADDPVRPPELPGFMEIQCEIATF